VDNYQVCLLNPRQPYGPQMREYGVAHSHKVPTLQMDGLEIGDSGVISQVLAEKYTSDASLAGTPAERLDMLQWVSMAETCITFRVPLLPALMNPEKSLAELQAEALDPMRAVFKANIARFESHFEQSESEFLLASGFSIADTMCGWSLFTFHRWGIMDLVTGESPRTLAYLQRLQARPAFKAAERYEDVSPGLYSRGYKAVI